jgi:HK97 gp10 family phage protein
LAQSIIEIKVLGLAELQKKLEELPFKVSKKILKETLLSVGTEFAERLAEAAPVSDEIGSTPGWLAEHFGTRLKIDKEDVAGAVFVGGQNVDYPMRGGGTRKHPEGTTIDVPSVIRYLELGTSRMPKHPFMNATWDSFKDSALDHVIADLRFSIEEAVK